MIENLFSPLRHVRFATALGALRLRSALLKVKAKYGFAVILKGAKLLLL
jgi:hypothetical protein